MVAPPPPQPPPPCVPGLDPNCPPPCFVSGTHIRTHRGEVCVEALRVGDRTISPDGSEAPIKWIAWRRVPARAVRQSNNLRPIRVLRDAFAEGHPKRDLLVSRDHGIYAEGALIPAWCLANGATIIEESWDRDVTYYHVELEAHGLLLAEGLATESYLDTGNRAFFSNALHVTELDPVRAYELYIANACAPQVLAGPAAQKVRQHLIERASHLGFAITDASDLSLLVDGRLIEFSSVEGRSWRFSIAEGTRQIRIVSRKAMPAGVSSRSEDRRVLGVAIGRLALHCEGRTEEISLNDPHLTDGFYEIEQWDATIWRWTNGDATLRFPMGTPASELELILTHGHYYWTASSEKVALRA
jgi:Hint domain-containing protein